MPHSGLFNLHASVYINVVSLEIVENRIVPGNNHWPRATLLCHNKICQRGTLPCVGRYTQDVLTFTLDFLATLAQFFPLIEIHKKYDFQYKFFHLKGTIKYYKTSKMWDNITL